MSSSYQFHVINSLFEVLIVLLYLYYNFMLSSINCIIFIISQDFDLFDCYNLNFTNFLTFWKNDSEIYLGIVINLKTAFLR